MKRKNSYNNTGLILNNRFSLMEIAREEYKQDKISKDQYRHFGFVFHPDFRNWLDSVPMERAAYSRQRKETDAKFWKEYGIASNFRINPQAIFDSYKEYVLERWRKNPELFQGRQFV